LEIHWEKKEDEKKKRHFCPLQADFERKASTLPFGSFQEKKKTKQTKKLVTPQIPDVEDVISFSYSFYA